MLLLLKRNKKDSAGVSDWVDDPYASYVTVKARLDSSPTGATSSGMDYAADKPLPIAAAAKFLSSTSSVSFPNSADVNLSGATSFCVDTWLNIPAVNSVGLIASLWRVGLASQCSYQWGINAGTLYAQCSYVGFVIQAPIATSGWTHLAWSRDNGINRLFINGKVVAVVNHSTSLPYNNSRPMYLGYRTEGQVMVSGSLAGFRITKGVPRYVQDFLLPANPLT